MLSPRARLRRSQDIQTTIKHGRSLRTPYVHMYFQSQPNAQNIRLACVVSKRVSASAVVRHRYQRLLRAAARQLLPQLEARWQGDIVLVALPSITAIKSTAELVESLTPYMAQVY